MVHSLVDPAQGRGGRALEPSHFREVFCSHLMEIKKTCLMAKLPNCYEGHVLNAHAAYLLEALKVTSTLVALHLDSKGDTTTDVASCPVFVEEGDLFHDQDGQKSRPLLGPRSKGGAAGGAGEGGGGARAGLVVAVVVLSLVILVAALGFAVIHFRLGPRVRAAASRVPYMDFLTNEQRGAANTEAPSLDPRRSRNDSELQVQGGPRTQPDVTA